MTPPFASLGIYTSIVSALRQYARPLPLDFLAHLISRQPEELHEPLRRLRDEGVVTVENSAVALAPGDHRVARTLAR
jgi:predicted transcriptional regulator